VKYSGIQLDTASYIRIQLDTIGYSGIQIQRDTVDLLCKMDRYRIDTGIHGIPRIRRDTGGR